MDYHDKVENAKKLELKLTKGYIPADYVRNFGKTTTNWCGLKSGISTD